MGLFSGVWGWGGGWRREGEDHPFSLEVSEDVQDGVQLLTKSIQLSSLVLGNTPPALYLRLLVRLKRWPRSINHLPEKKWNVMRSTWFRSEEQMPEEQSSLVSASLVLQSGQSRKLLKLPLHLKDLLLVPGTSSSHQERELLPSSHHANNPHLAPHRSSFGPDQSSQICTGT